MKLDTIYPGQDTVMSVYTDTIPLNIESLYSNNKNLVEIYPNPVSDYFQIKSNQEKTVTVDREKLSRAKYRIQLASVKSDKLARVAWKRYRQKFVATLGNLEPYIEKVLIPSKGTFHRVQAGVLDKIKAQKICSALITKKQPCIITLIKSGVGR